MQLDKYTEKAQEAIAAAQAAAQRMHSPILDAEHLLCRHGVGDLLARLLRAIRRDEEEDAAIERLGAPRCRERDSNPQGRRTPRLRRRWRRARTGQDCAGKRDEARDASRGGPSWR